MKVTTTNLLLVTLAEGEDIAILIAAKKKSVIITQQSVKTKGTFNDY